MDAVQDHNERNRVSDTRDFSKKGIKVTGCEEFHYKLINYKRVTRVR